jgi:hypothetical protein
MARTALGLDARAAAHESERTADAFASSLSRFHRLPSARRTERVFGERRPGGDALSQADRVLFEQRLRIGLASVRLHHDDAAARAADLLGARAFTIGNDIVFGRCELEPRSIRGRALLAHELAHVAQQRESGRSVQRQPKPDTDPGSRMKPGIPPQPPPQLPPALPIFADVDLPDLMPDGKLKGTKVRTFEVAEPYKSAVGLTWYAVPRQAAADAIDAAAGICRPLPPDDDRLRAALGLPVWRGLPWALPPPPTTAMPAPLMDVPTVLGAVDVRGDYVITSRYTKLAVGAGSVGIIETDRGFVLVDAGVGPDGHAELTAHVLEQIDRILGGRPIEEILLSHLHADHTSLLPELAARYRIGKLRINAYQKLDPRMTRILEEVARRQRSRIEAEVRKKAVAERATWEADPKSGTIPVNPDERETRFEKHVQELVRTELATSPIMLETMVPHEGKFHLVKSALTEQIKLPLAEGDPVMLEEGLLEADAVTGGPRITTATQSIERDLRKLAEEQEKDPKARARNEDVDANENTFVVELTGGARLYVLPDKRVPDIGNLEKVLRKDVDRLNAQLTRLGRAPAKLSVWEMGHHMQAGFVSTLSQMDALITNLHSVTRVIDASGEKSIDTVIVSGQGDPTNPAVRSLVDPLTVWLLRECGIQVYVATSNRTVKLLEVLTPTGKTIAGIAMGQPYEGQIPSEATLRRSEAARRYIDEQIKQAEANRPMPRGKPRAEYLKEARAHNERIEDLKQLQRDLAAARTQYLEAFEEKLRAGAAAGGQGAPRPDVTVEATARLKGILADSRLEAVPVEAGPQASVFDPVALTLLKLPPLQEFTAAQLTLAEAIVEVDSARAKVKIADSVAARGELIDKLSKLQKLLESYVKKAPPGTKELLEEEMKSIRGEFEQLTTPGAGKGTVSSQVSADGRYTVEERVSVEPEGRGPRMSGAQRVRWLADKTTRPMGAVMVYTFFKKQAQLKEGLDEGSVKLPEYLIGSAHSAYGVTIGIRMMGKVHVGMGEFAILAVLDVAETVSRDYDSASARDAAIAYSLIRNGIQLGLTYIGGRMIVSGNMYVAAAGFLLQFVVDPILEHFGVYDWLERKFDFLPDDVKRVEQKLRKLLKEYNVLIGLLGLNARGAADRLRLGGSTDAGLAALQKERDEYRKKVTKTEMGVLAAFEEGYGDARKDFAGLVELDTMRAQFVQMQYAAHEGDPDVAVSRERAIAAFARIEAGLSLDIETAESVHNMPQWGELRDQLGELKHLIHAPRPDWKDVLDRERRVTQVLDNARYRLNPALRGMRTTPLLQPGSEARKAYEEELEPLRAEADELHHFAIRRMNPFIGLIPDHIDKSDAPPDVVAVDLAEQTLFVYKGELTATAAVAGFPVERLKHNSIDAGVNYPKYIDDNDKYRAELTKLELLEGLLVQAIQRMRETNAAFIGGIECTPETGRIDQIEREAREATQARYEKGLWFKREAQQKVQTIRDEENRDLALRLGETGIVPLSFPEQAAIHEENLPYRTGGTIIDRLNAIPVLSRQGPDGYLVGIYRYEGFGTKPGQNVLVGDLGKTVEVVELAFDSSVEESIYVPLNEEAQNFFHLHNVHFDADGARLGYVALDDHDKDHLVKIKLEDLKP